MRCILLGLVFIDPPPQSLDELKKNVSVRPVQIATSGPLPNPKI